jgi:hypothetical protein
MESNSRAIDTSAEAISGVGGSTPAEWMSISDKVKVTCDLLEAAAEVGSRNREEWASEDRGNGEGTGRGSLRIAGSIGCGGISLEARGVSEREES